MKDADPGLTAVAEDVFQVRIPLPFALRIVNCYLFRGDGGWTILDTGLNTATGRSVWEQVMAELEIGPGAVEQIVLTHAHPDHFGMAGWLQQRLADPATGHVPPVRMSPREAEMARMIWVEWDVWLDQSRQFWHQCDLGESLVEAVLESTLHTRQRTLPHPPRLEVIEPGSTLQLGRRHCQALSMPGHSDGQLVFHEAESEWLFCGDHVLLEITPNISLWPLGEPNPLGRYLDSFHALRELNVQLAMPGHRRLITDFGGRLDALRHHHDERIDQALAAVDGATTVLEASRRLFNFDRLSLHEVRFAVAETLAHLEFLAAADLLTCQLEEVRIYRRP